MNEKETQQHVRDMKTAEKAVRDCEAGKYDRPHDGLFENLTLHMTNSEKDFHDMKVYDAAFKEAKKHKD